MSIIGVIHLPPLPGAPGHATSMSTIVDAARQDAITLSEAGFDAIIIENFGDAPFFADNVPPATVAAMTRVIADLADATDLDLGVNVLRNDGLAALAVAAATNANFVRINVLAGSMYTDQGLITGRAAEVVRLRDQICPDVVICADVMVKHATPPAGLTLADAASDLIERSGADAIIVSGSGTAKPTALNDVKTVAKLAGEMPVMVGSGVTNRTIASMLEVAEAVIVGTATKVDGVTTNAVDPKRARALVKAAKKES
ncbi:MAG: BtpA/SgcQ family protein [Acidimicrobiia bacterium]|nr:BtpA/SgcQ family protein [Acidimicrobiia bacterium]